MTVSVPKRTPSGKYADSASEASILRSITDYLHLRRYVFKRNQSGMMFGEHKGKKWVARMGEAGWPDIIGMTRPRGPADMGGGRFFGIEVKSARGQMSPYQEEIRARIVESNGLFILARSVQDVMDGGL